MFRLLWETLVSIKGMQARNEDVKLAHPLLGPLFLEVLSAEQGH
jgi:hypothetical protein